MTGRTYDTGAKWTDGPKEGLPVEYWELEGHAAMTDAAAF
jgi:hypothetical protein